MKLRNLLLAGTAAAMMTGVPAQASIVDNPSFRVLGLVIVWGADSYGDGTTAAAPIVSDFVVNTDPGNADADLIAGDVHTVVTGSLAPTIDSIAGSGNGASFNVTGATSGGGSTDSNSDGFLDATDTFGAFGLDATTDVGVEGMVHESSFYVASNRSFNIDATATPVGTPDFALSDIGYSLGVTVTDTDGSLTFGGQAQDPTGSFGTATDLAGLAAAPTVFTGAQRTAATPGTIVGQSVRFDATYTLGGTQGYDLSMGDGEIEVDVEYTIYMP
ncbi:MAG: hypothetical protein AAFX03_05780 [Pseudomonadota bacterium]